jgi:FkbM family methyltransferase
MTISKPKTEGWFAKYDYNKFHNYQIEEYKAAIKYVDKFRTAIDLGANLGVMSARMVKDFQFVHSFEPLFHEHLAENVVESNIKIYPYAVGEKNGSAMMRVGLYHSGGSNITTDFKETETYKEVSVVTVDSFDFKDVDFIKIDVEDYEWYVLQGAKKTIELNKPVILLELKDDNTYRKEILNFFQELNYKQEIVGDMDSVFYLKESS